MKREQEGDSVFVDAVTGDAVLVIRIRIKIKRMERIFRNSRCGGDGHGKERSSVDMGGIRIRNESGTKNPPGQANGECSRMNAECEGGGDGFYRRVVAQKRGNAQAVKRGNFGGKEEMEREKRKWILR